MVKQKALSGVPIILNVESRGWGIDVCLYHPPVCPAVDEAAGTPSSPSPDETKYTNLPFQILGRRSNDSEHEDAL